MLQTTNMFQTIKMLQTTKILLATAVLLQLTTSWTAQAYAVSDGITMISEDVTWIRKEVDHEEVNRVRRDLEDDVIPFSDAIKPANLSLEDIKPLTSGVRRSAFIGRGNTVTISLSNRFYKTYNYRTTKGSTLKLSCTNYDWDDFTLNVYEGKSATFDSSSSSIELTTTGRRLRFNLLNWLSIPFNMKCTVTASGGNEPVYPPVTSKPADCTCGISNKGSRIIGGTKAAPREFPWIVRVYTITNTGTYGCGGSIISPQHVVTAAHCTKFSNMKTLKVQVVYGADNLESSSRKLVDVAKVYDHPSYDPTKWAQDITVLKLKEKLTFDSKVSPICLPDAGIDYANMPAVIAGWGQTESGSGSDDLLKVDMTFASNEVCEQGVSAWEEKYMICTKYTPGFDSCRGDSGGPVMTEINGKQHLVGAVSFGPMPCATGGPGTNTRITTYLSWINGILNKNKDSPCQ